METHWTDVEGKRVRYLDRTWELTGDVSVRDRGERLAVDARRVDGVRRERATLFFELHAPPKSLNPGNLDVHFDRLERDDDGQYLVVKGAGRSYRYELQRLEYA